VIESFVLLSDEVVCGHVLGHVGVRVAVRGVKVSLAREGRSEKEEAGLLESDVRVDKEDIAVLDDFDQACRGTRG
jgi:hypothetical protein